MLKIKTNSLTLTFDHVIWKSIGVIYFLRASTKSNLATLRQRSQMILSGQHLYKEAVWPYLWPCDLKIDREIYFIYRGFHCIKFVNLQGKGSKDIKLTSLGLQTNWQIDRHTINIMYKLLTDILTDQQM